jgi:formate dehydrogenase major subunit
MELRGITVSRWIDGVLEPAENMAQKAPIKAMFMWGHAPNSQTRGFEMKKAMELLDLLVIVDPYPTHSAVMNDRTDGVFLLPAATQYETYGSVTASNRSIQWREKIIEPLFESLPDHTIMYKFAKKLGFAEQLTKHIQVNGDEPLVEDIVREYNRGMWTIGYTGQSPERLKLHLENKHTFNTTTLKAEGGPCDGEYYGLPWPCWGTPEMKHPGSPNLYDTSKTVAEGGMPFRANFGVEYAGQDAAAEGSWSKGSEIEDGYPEFTADMLKQLGWWDDLTDEQKAAEGKNWKNDLSGGIQRVAIKHGCAPYGNGKARCVVWNFPDPVPLHREPLYTSRHDLVAKYPTYEDRKRFWRLPTRYMSIQAKDYSKDYPADPHQRATRRVRRRRRGDPLEPVAGGTAAGHVREINPADANERGLKDGQWIWLEGPEGGKIKVKAMVTRRVARASCSRRTTSAAGSRARTSRTSTPRAPRRGCVANPCNNAFTYGYDSVTAMQETKASLCKITPA